MYKKNNVTYPQSPKKRYTLVFVFCVYDNDILIYRDVTDRPSANDTAVVRARFEPFRHSLFAPDWDGLKSVAR